MTAHSELEASAEAAGFALELFDRLPDVVFFIKDTAGRYVAVNETLVRRLGLSGKANLLGRTTCDLFPAPLGRGGSVVGLAGTSRDVHSPASGERSLQDLAGAVRHIQEHYDRPLRVEALAAMARLSPYRFTRRIRLLFGLTPAQLIIKTRLDAARRMLREGTSPVGQIAVACGYFDQSAFTRQFKAAVGLTPAQYRERFPSP
jgi:AraC-like DNA-binding protein